VQVVGLGKGSGGRPAAITAAFGAATAAALAAFVAMYRPLRTNPREESVGLAILWLIAIAGLVAHLAGL
jgi:hypothetical protein